jgi:hypothetical protein
LYYSIRPTGNYHSNYTRFDTSRQYIITAYYKEEEKTWQSRSVSEEIADKEQIWSVAEEEGDSLRSSNKTDRGSYHRFSFSFIVCLQVLQIKFSWPSMMVRYR